MTINISIEIKPEELMCPGANKLWREIAGCLLALSNVNEKQEKENSKTEEKKDLLQTTENSKVDFSDHAEAQELDTDGKPWDYKIHSSKKTKNQDGRWKLKRNFDTKIETEQQITSVVVPPPPTEDLLSKFMSKVTSKLVLGKITHNSLSTFLRENGIPDVASIQNFPQLLPDLIKKIEILA